MAAQAQLHQELILDLNTDVAEFCTSPNHYNLLAVGTYELDEATRERHGRLHVYSLVNSSTGSNSQPNLLLAATFDMPGIFDMQWTQLPSIHDKPCIGLALADGTLQLLTVAAAGTAAAAPVTTDTASDAGAAQVVPPHNTLTADHLETQNPAGEHVQLQKLHCCKAVSEGMALSLDWNNQQQQQQQQQAAPLVAVSSSSGSISVLQVQPAGVVQLCEWQGHELEAWMASWDKHQANVLYSGADDCTFKGWDIRCPTAVSTTSSTAAAVQHPPSSTASTTSLEVQDDLEPSTAAQQTALFSNRKAHGAGVCCISSHPRRQHTLVTGSYDESIRLWDVRMWARPVETCQASTGGGVWRLKWHPRDDSLLLAACMYNGCALVNLDDSWSSMQVVEQYKGHDSIAYGADWYKGSWPTQTDSCSAGCSTGACGSAAQQGTPDAATSTAASADAVVDALAGLGLNVEQQQQAGLIGQGTRDIIATCSFYDRRLHLWSPCDSHASST